MKNLDVDAQSAIEEIRRRLKALAKLADACNGVRSPTMNMTILNHISMATAILRKQLREEHWRDMND